MSSVQFGSSNTPNQNTQTAEQAAGAPAPEQQTQLGNDQNVMGSMNYGINELGSGIFGTGMQMSFNSGSEQLHRAKEALSVQLKKAIETLRKENVVGLVTLDRAEYKKLPYSVLVLTYENRNQPQVGRTFYTIVLAGDAQATTRNENVAGGQQTVEVMSLPDDAQAQCIKEVSEILKSMQPGVRLNRASGTVVSNGTFDWANEQQVYQLLAVAYNSCLGAAASRSPNFNDVNLARIVTGPLEVAVHRTKGQVQPRDVLGRPKRRDLEVQLRTRQQVNQQTGEVIQPSEIISSLSLYGELLYAPEQTVRMTPLGQQIPEVRTYRPRMIVTAMRNHQTNTLGAKLMGLIPAIALFQNKASHQTFYPAQNSGPGASDDVGVLNIEAKLNAGGPLSPEVGERANIFGGESHLLPEFLDKILSDSVELAIDIEVGGQDYQNESVLLKAALAENGTGEDKEYRNAYQRVIDTMNVLFNGEFAKHWKGGPIAVIDSVLEVGYYADRDGNLRDTRDVDTVAVMNKFAETTPLYCRTWSDALVNRAMPMPMRARDMRNVIENVIAPPTYTSRVFRLVFSANFIDAFVKSVDALNFRPYISLPNDARRDDRLAYAGAGTGITPNMGAGIFSTFGPTAGGAGGIGQFSRWSV